MYFWQQNNPFFQQNHLSESPCNINIRFSALDGFLIKKKNFFRIESFVAIHCFLKPNKNKSKQFLVVNGAHLDEGKAWSPI